MMLKIKHLGLTACGVLLLMAPAAAQVSAPREAAKTEFGPVSLYPTLQILNAGVDDNVFNDANAPQRDTTATIEARVLTVLRMGSNELLFRVGSDYLWFHEFSSERSNNPQYAVRFNLTASRFKPFVGAEYLRSSERRGPEIDARARRTERIALAGAAFDLSPRTALTASIRFDGTDYDEGEEFRGVALDDQLNRSGRGGEAGVRYAITPLTMFSVTAGYEEQTFRQSHLRDLKRFMVGPSFEFSPEAAIQGRASAVFELFRPEDPALAESKGVAYQAALTWTLYGRTTFEFEAGRNFSYSYQDTEPYYLLTAARLLVNQPLAGRLELYGGVDWDHMAYQWRKGAPGASTESDRVDTVVAVGGGIGIRLGSGFRVRIGADKMRRRSIEDPLQSFNRTRILTTVTMGS